MLRARKASRNAQPALLCCAPAMPLILLNKPYRVLCQFKDDEGRPTLAEHIDVAGVYPAGRLDFDSEGLLLLTDDGGLQARISQPSSKLSKHYWAHVEGLIEDTHLSQLTNGVSLKDGAAIATGAEAIAQPGGLWARVPPIRDRRKIPTSWIDLAITAGRNRQVRRMTAAVGLPTLRLIRHRIGPWSVTGLAPGGSLVIDNKVAWKNLTAYLEKPLA